MTYEDERRLFEKSHAARKLLRLKAERAVKENKMKDQQRKKKKKQSPRLSQDVMDDEEKEPLECKYKGGIKIRGDDTNGETCGEERSSAERTSASRRALGLLGVTGDDLVLIIE